MSNENPQYTKEQLKSFSKELLVEMVLAMQSQLAILDQKIDLLLEGQAVNASVRFGRHTEKSSQIPHQMELCFNEAEITIVDSSEVQLKEPTLEEVNPANAPKKTTAKKHTSRPKGKLDEILKPFPVDIQDATLEGDRLICECGGTLKPMKENTYHKLEFTPATFRVREVHVWAYKCDNCGKIVYADHPVELFDTSTSLATPTLLAGIMTAKYINAIPLYRLEKSFADANASISRQTMAKWMILSAKRYFSLLYDYLADDLRSCPVIHADETTVKVSKDGRPAGTNSYMWVYTKEADEHPVVIYDYEKTRAASHAKEFLQGYKGYLCCDGYEAYHSLDSNIVICGCWAHARRHFANALKATPTKEGKESYAIELQVATAALQKIADLFAEDNQHRSLPPEEHFRYRQTELKKDVDSYFEWVRKQLDSKKVRPKSETGKGLTYSINQEAYLRGFLENGIVPLDNSEAERKIRNFVVARKNFVLIDSLAGAESSAVLFSIAETARANNLKPYEYFKYLLEELPKHENDPASQRNDFIKDLLPWSDKLPETIKKPKH